MTLVKESIHEEQRQEQRIPMSYEEFLTAFDETVHAEWVNGEAVIFMPPIPHHQNVVLFLASVLRSFVDFFQLGQVLMAPLEMKVTPDSNARKPDILFVAKENLWRITDKKLAGPADLIVEVISDDSIRRNRDDKFFEYQSAGVHEYWILDARPGRHRADFYVLDANGRYRPVPMDEDGIYRSTIIPNLWLDTNWLWQDELPDPLRTITQLIGLDRAIAALTDLKRNGNG